MTREELYNKAVDKFIMGLQKVICKDGIERKGVVMFHPDKKED